MLRRALCSAMRFLFVLLLLSVPLAACDRSDEPSGEGTVPGPGGQLGVCCPPGIPSCDCTPQGGWAPSMAECTSGSCDVRTWTRGTHEWGCAIVIPNRDFTDPENNCFPLYPDLGPERSRPRGGQACSPEHGCGTVAAVCLHDVDGEGNLGGPDDPIRNHPDGEDTVVERALFPGGWCNNSYPGMTSSTCDPEDPTPVCSEFGTCVVLAVGPVCADSCDPSAPGNDDCRDGYRCDLEHPLCQGSCRVT